MLKKSVIAVAAVALLAVLTPSPVSAQPSSAVAVFTGTAQVGTTSGVPGVGDGAGLCSPGFGNNAGGACTPGNLNPVPPHDVQGVRFDVPGTDPGPPPPTCMAAGAVFGMPVVDPACEIMVGGPPLPGDPLSLVTANAAGVGPGCGMSRGVVHGRGRIDGVPFRVWVHWDTSAGGVLPIIGEVVEVDANGNPTGRRADLVSLVIARPKAGGGNCFTAPANDFTVAGVAMVAGT